MNHLLPIVVYSFMLQDLHRTKASYRKKSFQEMGLWTLLEGCLLIANALAILNEDRFLAPRGWSFKEYSGVKRNSLKGQIIGLIYATQYLRVLLMILNSLCIVVKLVSGWLWYTRVHRFFFLSFAYRLIGTSHRKWRRVYDEDAIVV